MTEISLLNSTQNAKADRLLQNVIGLFEMVFAGRVRAYYVKGSYADNSPVGSSDIDLTLLFKGSFEAEAERAQVEQLAHYCVGLSEIELDISLEDETKWRDEGLWPNLQMGGLLVYGTEVRDQFEIVSVEQWTRDRMHSSYWRTARLFERVVPLTYPLALPDPNAEFGGYDQRKVRLPDGREVNCTRDLIRLTGWAATALIAYQTGHYVSRKRDCHLLYRQLIGDEWAALLDEIYQKCRVEWNYLIPTDVAAHQELRDICQRTLNFENHFLTIYKKFALEQLEAADPSGQNWALRLQREIPFADAEIIEAIKKQPA